MELEKLGRQLQLLLMLTQNVTLTVDDLGKELNMSRRTIYRYIDAFKSLGFTMTKTGTKYRIEHTSPFLRKLVTGMQFTDDEALLISQALNSVYDNSAEMRALREKLARVYNPKLLVRHGKSERFAHNLTTLYACMREERVALIKNYDSPSSGKVSNRIVEPYLFLDNNNEVRCYELASHMNKTFKLGRMEAVVPLDIFWTNKKEHRPFFTDLFHFSGEKRTPVTLILGHLATNVLLEEYPGAEDHLTEEPDGRHRIQLDVCSMKGVGRFVMGLADDVEVVNSPELVDYLRSCAKTITKKFS